MTQYADFMQYELESDTFDKLLNGPLTYRVAHRRSERCPCWNDERGSPDYNCPVCHGVGYLWDAVGTTVGITETFYHGSLSVPQRLGKAGVTALTSVIDEHGVTYDGVTLTPEGDIVFPSPPPDGTGYTVTYDAPTQMRLHAQSIKSNREWADRGELFTSDLQSSIPRHLADLTTPNPAWFAAEHDRFIFLDLQKRTQERYKRGVMERLTYQTVRSLTNARAILDGALVRYTPGVDFEVQDGSVAWLTAGPPPGTDYVLEYVAAPEYYVFGELAQMRHIDGIDLPRRVGLRLFENSPYKS